MRMAYKVFVALMALVVLGAVVSVFVIGRSVTTPLPTTNTAPVVANTNQMPATNANVPSTPSSQPISNSPLLKHDIYITFSADPASFPAGTLVTKSGSVPDVLVCTATSAACNKGDLLIYFVDPLAAQPSSGVSMIKSTDGGKTWSDRQTITVSNKTNKGPVVDPSVVQLANGSLRLYFFAPDAPIAGSTDTSSHHVDSATSTDGLNFTVESGLRFSAQNLTDPEVVTNGTTWFMYYSLGLQSGVATSTDGLIFTKQGTLPTSLGGVPGAIVLPSGSVRAYGCTQTGIQTATSPDGIDFGSSTMALSGTQICDPSVQPLGDKYVMVYKHVEP